MTKEQLKRLEDIMAELGDVHNAIAATSLSTTQYNPISLQFSKAKIDLFNLYKELKETVK